MNSQRKFGSDRDGNPNYGRETVGFFFIKNQSSTRSRLLGWRYCFRRGIKWDVPLGLDFGLGFWKLHTMAVLAERPWEFMAKGSNFGLGLWSLYIATG